MSKYLPLSLLEQNGIDGNSFEWISEALNKIGYKYESEDQLLKRVMSLKKSDKKNNDISDKIEDTINIIFAAKQLCPYMDLNLDSLGGISMAVYDAMDIICTPLQLDKWARCKQVYKPDPDFAGALIRTENLIISKYMIDHLPCNHFFIDTSDIPFLADETGGIFVNVYDLGSHVCICAILLAPDCSFTCCYSVQRYDSQGNAHFNLKNTESDMKALQDEYVSILGDDYQNEYYGWESSKPMLILFAAQMIAYLFSSEPDITESMITKNTYRPSKEGRIKNRFNEIQQWDTGVKYGTAFRKFKKEYHQSTHDTQNLSHKKNRKPPIPHFKNGHYRHYHVGKGRSQTIVKWIAPYFTGGKGKAKDVVIHIIDGK